MPIIKKVNLFQLGFYILFVLWLFFALLLSFKNLRQLYYDYVKYNNKTDGQKEQLMMKEASPLIEVISNNTPNNAKILAVIQPFKNSTFFNYYLYPRKIYWFQELFFEKATEFARKNNIEFVVTYNKDKQPLVVKVTE